MRLVLVAGARPQFIKAAALLPALRARHEVCFLHTGQHASASMVDAHFAGLEIPEPDLRHAPAEFPRDLEEADRFAALGLFGQVALKAVRGAVDRIVVMGDTDSTVAGARCGEAMSIPVAHVEAGARSGEPDLVEERNRIEVDRIADLCFCSTPAHAANLAGEAGVHVVGDVMADVLKKHRATIDARRPGGEYSVLTLHRARTADSARTVAAILEAVASSPVPVVFPKHPRLRSVPIPAGIEVLEPLPYLDFLGLVAGARFVLTDSGGLQKEACLLGVPCITLRDATEWGETVAVGCNVLVGTDPCKIRAAIAKPPHGRAAPDIYGDGHASERIAAVL